MTIPLITGDIKINRMTDDKLPIMIPLRANSLTGTKGSRTGVKTAPDKIPVTSAMIDKAPLCQAPEKEKTPGPKPEMTNKTRAVISAVFSTIWISTGVRMKRSYMVKVTCRILLSAFLSFSRKVGISLALTGPYTTLNPDSFLTSLAETPVAPSWGTMTRL